MDKALEIEDKKNGQQGYTVSIYRIVCINWIATISIPSTERYFMHKKSQQSRTSIQERNSVQGS